MRAAAERGFSVGIVTNGYWAGSVDDALVWLTPMVGLLNDLSVSTDLLHSDRVISAESQNVLAACEQLGIPAGTITCALPGAPAESEGGPVHFRGRAAARLAGAAPLRDWSTFDECPYEDLEDPDRVHLDPDGNLHLCQGLVMGNLFERPLAEIVASYEVADHPIAGPLAAGGPAELVRVYDVPHAPAYADACHLCYSARENLRTRFPEHLATDAMYGVGLR